MTDKMLLLGALIGLARATDGNAPSESTHRTMLEGLLSLAGYSTEITLDRIHDEKYKLIPGCIHCASPCGRTADYSLEQLHAASDGIRRRKALLLSALYGIAPTVYRNFLSGCDVSDSCRLIYGALFAVGEDWDENYLDSEICEITDAALQLLL